MSTNGNGTFHGTSDNRTVQREHFGMADAAEEILKGKIIFTLVSLNFA